jgi:phenylacetate-CoA ligase
MVFHGANIYPSEIREVLDRKKYQKYITGRFTLEKKENHFAKTHLWINVELQPKRMSSRKLTSELIDEIHAELLKRNSEYHYLWGVEGKNVLPRLKLWENGTKKFFSRQGKQSWVQKKKK